VPNQPVAAVQPRALIVTIYGLYARDESGWLSIASLIRLLAELGVDEPAVRSSISRLKQRGLLERRQHGGAAGYGLSGRGRSILAEGDRRIFRGWDRGVVPPGHAARPRAGHPDGWLLAVFSVPEQERSKRHALRSRLTWLGFGTVSSGVWIAPGQLADQVRDVLAADGMAEYVSLFTASYLAFGDVAEQVRRWWDLDRLEQLYQSFIDTAEPVLAFWDGNEDHAAGRAFADYVRVLTAWRRLPFLDPGLPAELLPADWHGARAADLFDAISRRLAAPAAAHVAATVGTWGSLL
jgi:phenylacetic acid degradation operon negative regulatory protein